MLKENVEVNASNAVHIFESHPFEISKYFTRSVQNLNSMPNKCLSNYFAFKSLYCLHCLDCGLDISETLDHTTRLSASVL